MKQHETAEIYIVGKVKDTPKVIRVGKEKTPMCRFRISVGRPDGKRDILQCCAWHNAVKQVTEEYHFQKDDIVAFSGTIRSHRYVQSGIYHSTLQIVVTKVECNCGKFKQKPISQEEIDKAFEGEDLMF